MHYVLHMDLQQAEKAMGRCKLVGGEKLGYSGSWGEEFKINCPPLCKCKLQPKLLGGLYLSSGPQWSL